MQFIDCPPHGADALGVVTPTRQELSAAIRRVCQRQSYMLGHEASTVQEYILSQWDFYALRTWWWYFYDDIDQAELSTLDYYFRYYNEASQTWSCINPSAAAVHTVRHYFYTVNLLQ